MQEENADCLSFYQAGSFFSLIANPILELWGVTDLLMHVNVVDFILKFEYICAVLIIS